MLSRVVQFILIAVVCFAFTACTERAPAAPDPVQILQQIPAGNASAYEHIRNMKTWRNPYLIVRTDGVALLDIPDNAEIVLKPEEVLPALAKLPPTNWPYGRVVAVAENSVRGSEQDAVAIRRNKGIVGGVLGGAHIEVKWVPAA